MKDITKNNLDEFINYYHSLHDSYVTNINYDVNNSKIELLIDVCWSGDPILKEDDTYETNKTKIKMILYNINKFSIKEMFSWDYIDEVFSSAHNDRKSTLTSKIQGLMQEFDKDAKDKCSDAIMKCAMRSCVVVLVLHAIPRCSAVLAKTQSMAMRHMTKLPQVAVQLQIQIQTVCMHMNLLKMQITVTAMLQKMRFQHYSQRKHLHHLTQLV